MNSTVIFLELNILYPREVRLTNVMRFNEVGHILARGVVL